MAGKPVATIGSMHVCPMVTGYIPHVGGPVSGPGMPGVTINGQPIAVIGDMCTCVGPPDTIVQGCPGVTVNGTPVATLGSMTAHGGQITVGVPGVTVGPNTPTPDAVMPLKQIPFPNITLLDRVGAAIKGKSKDLKQAKKNQEQIKEEATSNETNQEPAIVNLEWGHEQRIVRQSKVIKQVNLIATVSGINDGEMADFYLKRDVLTGNEGESEEVTKLSGTVKEGKVEITWEVEDNDQK
ncbi:PAAR domain-containing protein [Marinilabilia salmonicolor]|uniref:Putative Zn-binding protein involved in type VI secretion n=1 Tax=Marinilabilia salmonicolor TaxID=989 RepID=A0A368UTQ5_9BACT|nr:PAAR domain-containing protein [Marinilabilia salmonicolor]RCW30241.1 putative Zn-binding protein involved in type VI secretion [Marinilabilia salmonicolor]